MPLIVSPEVTSYACTWQQFSKHGLVFVALCIMDRFLCFFFQRYKLELCGNVILAGLEEGTFAQVSIDSVERACIMWPCLSRLWRLAALVILQDSGSGSFLQLLSASGTCY